MTDSPPSKPGWGSLPPVRYPNAYAWFVLVSAMDIMLTWQILRRGGQEVNPIAEAVISHWGLPGAIGFKFALMMFVIVAVEIVGRARDRLGRMLVGVAVFVSALPVAWSITLLFMHRMAQQ